MVAAPHRHAAARELPVANSLTQLVFEARRLVAYTNREFAKLTGVSLRTVERHSHKMGISSNFQLDPLIQAVHPKSPELAARIAAAAGRSLEALGLPPPPPEVAHAQAAAVRAPAAPPPPPRRRPSTPIRCCSPRRTR